MKPDPELPVRFADTVLEELATIRAELFAQRKLLIELLSRVSKERRRKIKDRLYDERTKTFYTIARDLKRKVWLEEPDTPK